MSNRLNRLLRWCAALGLAVVSQLCFGQSFVPAFKYFGFDLALSDIKIAFPSSHVHGDYVYVSPRDSRGHVYAAHLRDDPKQTSLYLGFEKSDQLLPKQRLTQSQRRQAQYPTCQSVLTGLVKSYGAPTHIDQGWEEAMWNRERTWAHGDETMLLTCYRVNGKGTEFASSLRFTRTLAK